MGDVLTERQVKDFADSRTGLLKAVVDIKHDLILPFSRDIEFERFVAALAGIDLSDLLDTTGMELDNRLNLVLSKFVPVLVSIADHRVTELRIGREAGILYDVVYSAIDLAHAKNLVRRWLVNSRFGVMPQVLRKVA